MDLPRHASYLPYPRLSRGSRAVSMLTAALATAALCAAVLALASRYDNEFLQETHSAHADPAAPASQQAQAKVQTPATPRPSLATAPAAPGPHATAPVASGARPRHV